MGDGIFRQKNGMVAIDIVASCGVMTPEQLSGLARLSEECGVFRIKLSTRQTLVAVLDEKGAGRLVESLPGLGLKVSPYGNVVRAVKACAGSSALCPRAVGEALALGIEIQDKYLGMEVPKDFKIAVAGCLRGCTDPYCADLGIVSSGREVFDVSIGGFGGSSKPLHGEVVARRIKREDVFLLIDHVLNRFRALGEPGEKLGRAITRLGLTPFLPPAGVKEAQQAPPDDFVKFLED
ncbi:MAG: nitrite reductase [Peptococcaceae bacterium BICA1-7]|nr:MAG: nitrite reductase [Peptococcaceae bacterium BICA1-7]HBV95427.1 nitrite reductase [Desulfotomaculum sp.]